MTTVLVIGTRPECLKLAPLYRVMPSCKVLALRQHTDLLDKHLREVHIKPDMEMTIERRPDDSLSKLTSLLIDAADYAFDQMQPTKVVVQGDTSTALAASIAAFHRQIPVAHVEAGLRSGDFYRPFPEEMNRRLIDRLATWHFCPTVKDFENLYNENIRNNLYTFGNTGIDQLYFDLQQAATITVPTDYNLVTFHRREGRAGILNEFLRFLIDYPGRFVWITHPSITVDRVSPRVTLYPPVDHATSLKLIEGADLVFTDSGGIIEEAMELGKKVVILRNETERQAALAYAVLWPRTNPTVGTKGLFGDGRAAEKIAEVLRD